MIYRGTRKIVKIALAIFFRKIVINGNHIPENGPVILAANHPNTLMDPLIIAALTGRRIGFVANAGLFSSKIISRLFKFFHVIPIYRKKDVLPGEKPDNNASFAKCHEYLRNGGAFLIFPEGSSFHELRLREIKTGTARIALSFESQTDFQSGLKIIPIALDYSDALQFNSMVVVTVNEPIETKNFQANFTQNEIEAVNDLTEAIRKSLAIHIPQTSGKEQEDYLIKAHKFYATYYEPGADLYYDAARSLELRSQLSYALHYVDSHNHELYDSIRGKIDLFFDRLKASDLTTGFFTDEFNKKNPLTVIAGYFAIFILLLPFYLAGIIANYIPYILPSKIFQLLKMEIEYKASVQLVVGVFSFPIFYAMEIFLFRKFISTDLAYSLLILVLIPITGYVAMYYWTELKRFIRVLRFYFFSPSDQKKEMIKLRDEILSLMEEARKQLT